MDSNLLSPDQPEAIEQAPAQTGPPTSRLQKAYDLLKTQDVKVPDSYDEFERGVLDKPERLRQLYDHFKQSDIQVPDDFGQFEAGMLDGVKKKSPPAPAGGTPSGTTSATGSVEPSMPPQDREFVAVDPTAALETVQPFAPGTAAAPLAQNLADPSTGQFSVQGTRLPAAEENAYLAALPAAEDKGVRVDGSAYEQTPYGKELVAIPNDYSGAVPPGTFQLNLTGKGDRTQYFYRDLSDEVGGKKQSVYEAAAGRFKNSIYEMGQGVVEGTQAVGNLPAAGYELATGEPGYHLNFGDKASASIEQGKTELAPLYTKNLDRHSNFNNVLLQSADYAPLVVSQVVQTLAPELRVPGLLTKAISTTATVGFDAQMVHSAREGAKAAGLTGNKADLYTAVIGGLTLAGFKVGGKFMGEAGDKAVTKMLPSELRDELALRVVRGVEEVEQKLGRTATKAEVAQVLSQKVRAAIPKFAQIPKQALQQMPVFAAVEAASIGADQVLAPALGGQAEQMDAEKFGERMKDSAFAGLTIGGITGGVDAALPGRVSGLATKDLLDPAQPWLTNEQAPQLENSEQIASETADGEVSLPDEPVEQTPAVPSEQLAVDDTPSQVAIPSAAGVEPLPSLGENQADGAAELAGDGLGEGEPANQSPSGVGAEQAAPTGTEQNLPPEGGPPPSGDSVAPEPAVTGSAERKTVASIDEDATISDRLKAAMRDTGLDKYEPKSVADTEKEVDAYLGRVSLEEATAKAVAGTNLHGDVRTALRVKVMEQLDKAATAAEAGGDSAAAEQHATDALSVAEALAKTLTDAGREVNAAKLINRYAPAAVEQLAKVEVQKQRVKAEAKLEKKELPKERRAIVKEKVAAVDGALTSRSVRAAKEAVTGAQSKPTTKEQLADLKDERSAMFAELKKLTSNLGITPQQQREAELHVAIFKNYIKTGILKVRELVEQFTRDAPAQAARVGQPTLIKRATAALGDHQHAVKQGVEQLGTTLDRIARDFVSDHSGTGRTLAEAFVADAGLDPAAAKKYAAAIEAEFDRRIDASRKKRLAELDKRAAATPTKRAAPTDLDKTRELFTLSPTDDTAILDHLKRVNELPNLSVADVANLRKLARAVQQAPEGFQKDAAVGELMKAQARIKGINPLEVASSLWYSSILSSLKTHGINIFANTGQLLAEPTVSVVHGLIPGSKAYRGKYAGAGVVGLAKGLKRGAREAYSSITTGREVSGEQGKYDIPGVLEYINFKGGKLNPANYAKYVPRALRAMDMLFSTGLKEMRAYELATTEALADEKNGVPGPDVWARVSEKLFNTTQRIADAQAQAKSEGLTGNDYQRRVFEIAEQSRPAELVDDSREYGTRAVFNGVPKGLASTVAHGLGQIADGVSIGGVKPVKLIIPFTRVISSVANAVMDYTPIGAVRAANSLVRAKAAGSDIGGAHLTATEGSERQRMINGEERERLLLRSVLGGAAMTVLYQLSHDKDEDGNPTIEITGNGSGDVQKDAQLKASEGWIPNSIKYKGRYYAFSNTPFALVAGFVGNVRDAEKYRSQSFKRDPEALSNMSKAAFESLVGIGDITAARGPRDFLQATRTPEAFQGWLRRLAGGTAQSAIPLSGLAAETANYFYDTKKEAHTFAEAMQRNVPGARNGLNDAVDVLGDPLPNASARLWSSLPARDEPTEKLWAALRKNDLFISVPSRQMGGTLVVRPEQGVETPMNDQEFYDFMRARGRILKGALLAQVDGLSGDKVQAERLLREAAKMATAQAKYEVFGGNLTTNDRVDALERASGRPKPDDE